MKKAFFLFSLLFIFALGTSFVFAREALPAGAGTTLPEIVKYFFRLAMSLATMVSVAVIIFGGLHYLISFGTGKITREGLEWVKAGVFGLLLLVCSYLIMNTINPNLISLKITDLLSLPGFPSPSDRIINPNLKKAVYTEIPIGTLTETLLTRTTDCYSFDGNGDPIDADPSTPFLDPGLKNHDRIDCVLQLTLAAEKIAKAAKDLSDEIVRLMETCKCDENKCSPTCDQTTQCYLQPNLDCSNDIYAPWVGLPDVCEGECKNTTCTNRSDQSCCPAGVKEQIEHGQILLTTGCSKQFRGLDEFRSDYDPSLDLAKIDGTEPGSQGVVEEIIEVNGAKQRVIRTDVWYGTGGYPGLKLVDKLRYFKDKVKDEKNILDKDLDNLTNAKTMLSRCYFARPYVEFLQIIEQAQKEDTIVSKTTPSPFQDPETNQGVDIAKYCTGFGYGDSTCYQSCQKICPGINEESLGLFHNCDSSNAACLKNAFYTCPSGSGFSTFQECLTGCKKQCKENCDKQTSCSTTSATTLMCKDKCDKDSSCLIANDSKCYADFNNIKKCADLRECTGTTTQCDSDSECDELSGQTCDHISYEKFKICSTKAYSCKYCTDQYAGYPDCVNNTTPKTCTNTAKVCRTNADCNPVFGEKCLVQYSSSYLFLAKTQQKTPICVTGSDTSGVKKYPDCAKCPSCSKCPDCPCNIDQSSGKTLNRVCTSVCQDYSYDDNPLTFYCLENGQSKELADWKEKWPNDSLAKTLYCSKSKEIPIGQTVDDSEKWAKDFSGILANFVDKSEAMINYIKKISDETADQNSYCRCDSVCQPGENVCEGNCLFWRNQSPYMDPDTGVWSYQWNCGCAVAPCQGSSCQKIMNLLQGKPADTACPKGIAFDGIGVHHDAIVNTIVALNLFSTEKRSEILKELVYSRKTINSCSQSSVNSIGGATLLNCEKVEDYLLSPIKGGKSIINGTTFTSRCYGQNAGKILSPAVPLTDNWFCCENYNVNASRTTPY